MNRFFLFGVVAVSLSACLTSEDTIPQEDEETGVVALADTSGCVESADCNDGNECVVWTCVRGLCFSTPFPSAMSCDEQPLGYCSGGVCVTGMGSECDSETLCSLSLNDCVGEACVNGYCVQMAIENGSYCPNAFGNSVCIDGECAECANDGQCDDGNPCTEDKCEGGFCSHDPYTTSLPACGNGDFCWAGECCNGCLNSGVCVAQCPGATTCIGHVCQ